jgi:putative DNA primase/helicase
VAEGILKRLTGQDNLSVHRKHKPSITMAPSIKLTFATNTLPRFKDKTSGTWRRLIAMPFNVTITEDQQDEMLPQRLEQELPGILNWAIQGLQRLLQQNGFTSCRVCETATAEHRFDCDPFQQFRDECIVLSPTGRRIEKKRLYKLYAEWCEENGRKALSSGEFVRMVTKLPGVEPGRDSTGKREYFFRGISMIGSSSTIPSSDDEESE